MDTMNHAGIIEMMHETHIPESFIPYNTLLAIAAIFAVVIWVSSKALKRLRIREYKLINENLELERKLERESREREYLVERLGEMYGVDEDENLVNSS